jgi:hypothetical protein
MTRSRLAASIAVVGIFAATSGCPAPPSGPCSGPDAVIGCGRPCAATGMCAPGLHCGDDGRCTASCSATFACSDGRTCAPDGTCPVPVDAGHDAAVVVDVGPIDAPPGDTTCASVRVATTRVTPNVILVIDRSGSMNLDFDGGRSRWDVLDESLYGMPDGLVFDLAAIVRFGVVMYSEDPDFGGCPDLSREPARIANYTALAAQYDASTPGGNTPTGQAIEAVLTDIASLAPVRTDPTVIVLATDGEPATCEDGTDIVSGRARTVSAVTTAFDMDIQTFVVSVGTEIAMEHLQDVANAGVGRSASDPDAPFWVATSADGLHDALSAIVSGVVSCEVELVGEIDPARACEGSVMLGTDALACGTEWRAVDATHIEILDAACERLRRSTEDLVGTFPCDVVVF